MEELSIDQLSAQMQRGAASAVEITTAYLERIRQLDKQGPAVNAVIELNPAALEIAAVLDAERRDQGPRGALHGIPVLLKDNIDTGDQMATTAGSLALAGSRAAQDAFIVARLRQAGAVILGKTNLSEWANFRGKRSTSGWSSLGGQTRNPYALDRTPCGSSSGSGVAVAANFCAVSVGTETDGSIICPAAFNGIVGIKPTVGLASRTGLIPIAPSQDTAGPMARTVRDAAILLGALTGIDPADRATQASAGKVYTDYTPFLDPHGLRGARIGVARAFFGHHPAVDRVMESAIAEMRRQGAEIIDPAEIVTARQFKESEFEVLVYEFKAYLNVYLAGRGAAAQVHSLQELIDFNERHREKVMPFFGQEIFLTAQEKGSLQSEAYRQALEQNLRLARTEGIDATLSKDRLDAIIAPSGPPAWMTDLILGDHSGGGSSGPAAVAGYPSITVPAGYICGLPVGLSFIGGAYQEPMLLKLAFAFEQATQARRPPQLLPTADLAM
ncbi:MAG: amidase [Chloroflexi bacterium]|nr:amidase [Chloroflexota bacterium]